MMEEKPAILWLKKIGGSFSRMKFPILILALGTLFMLLPGRGGERAQAEAPPQLGAVDPAAVCQASLEEILSSIQGVGTVRVMLTVKCGALTEYEKDTQTDRDQSEEDTSLREERATVLISRGSGNEEAVISRITGPVYQGAIVVCGGGDDPKVKLAVVQAVCSVTGLGADQVTVLKMK